MQQVAIVARQQTQAVRGAEKMTSNEKCPDCGGPLTPGQPCPACLLGVGLESMSEDGAGSQTPDWVPPTIEELAGRFPELELIEILGRGGMGAVYKARQAALNRLVAIKILPPEIGRSTAFTERFTREAHALARLNHPNIVTIHDFGERAGLYFFMMEYVDGVNLYQLLETGRVSPREALAIVPQICDALQCAHDQGIVHRDIKPANILIDRRGHVKIADFGLAKLVEAGTEPADASVGAGSASHTLAAVGTPAYMAPEQADHPGEVDHRADIYALGVVFYQMLTGELPGEELEPPSRRGVLIDVRLDEIVLQALEKNPQRRYSQASILKTCVEDVTVAMGSPQVNQPPRKAPTKKPSWDIAHCILSSIFSFFAVMLAIVTYSLLFVVPKMVAVWAEMEFALSLPAKLTANLSHIFKQYGVVIVPMVLLDIVVTLIWMLRSFHRLKSRRARWGFSLGWIAAVALGILGLTAVHLPVHQHTAGLAGKPHELRKLSTPEVLEAGLEEPDLPWAWQELEERAGRDRITGDQAALIVRGLTDWLVREHPQGFTEPLFAKENLLSKLHQKGLTTESNAVAFVAALHGSPTMQPRYRIRESDKRIGVTINWRNSFHGTVMGLALLNNVIQVTIDGQPVEWNSNDYPRNHSNFFLGLMLPALTPGKHTLRFEIDSALIRDTDAVGLDKNAAPEDWPTSRLRWKRSCDAEILVYADDAEIVSLVEHAELDPAATGGLSVEQIQVHSTDKGAAAQATIVMDITKQLSVPISFDASLHIAGTPHKCGFIWHTWTDQEKNRSSATSSRLQVKTPPLAPDVRTADLILTPSPRRVDHVPEIEKVWGSKIVFTNIPLQRLDLGDSETVTTPTVASRDQFVGTWRWKEGGQSDDFFDLQLRPTGDAVGLEDGNPQDAQIGTWHMEDGGIKVALGDFDDSEQELTGTMDANGKLHLETPGGNAIVLDRMNEQHGAAFAQAETHARLSRAKSIIAMALGVIILLLGVPFAIIGLAWTLMGIRKGLGWARGALFLAVATLLITFVLFTAALVLRLSAQLIVIILILLLAGELPALLMGIKARQHGIGKAAIWISVVALSFSLLIMLALV